MTISFFGHREICDSAELEKKLLFALNKILDDCPCELLFGGYGMFDNLAYKCCRKLLDSGKSYDLRFIFVTPYVTESYLKNQIVSKALVFDEIVYPPIEKVPYKFAISARNKWMVEQSDTVISYVNKKYGGAYSSYLYAKGRNKSVINIGSLEN